MQNIQMKNEFSLHILGLHTIRYNLVHFLSDHEFIYPLGCYLNKYSIKTKSIVKKINIDHSLIMCAEAKDKLLVFFCYNGNGAVVDDNLNILQRISFPRADSVKHLAISNDLKYIACSCEGYIDIDEKGGKKDIKGAFCLFENRGTEGLINYVLVKVIKR